MITKNSVSAAKKGFGAQIRRVDGLVNPVVEAFDRIPDIPVENPDPLAVKEALSDKKILDDEAHEIFSRLIDSYIDIVSTSLKRVRFLMRNGPYVYSDAADYGDDLTEQGMISASMLNQLDVWKEQFAEYATPDQIDELSQKIAPHGNDLFKATEWMEGHRQELFDTMRTSPEEFDAFFSYVPAIAEDPKDFFSQNTLALGEAYTRAAEVTFDLIDNDLNRFGVIDYRLIPYGAGPLDELFNTRTTLRNSMANELNSARAHLGYAKKYLDKADTLAVVMN